MTHDGSVADRPLARCEAPDSRLGRAIRLGLGSIGIGRRPTYLGSLLNSRHWAWKETKAAGEICAGVLVGTHATSRRLPFRGMRMRCEEDEQGRVGVGIWCPRFGTSPIKYSDGPLKLFDRAALFDDCHVNSFAFFSLQWQTNF